MKMSCTFTPGDPVIYRITKHSDCPGPRAKAISPSPNGDDYKYHVDKFWVVDQVLENGQLVIRTRRGKTRMIKSDDLNLRTPRWWEYLLYRRQFPTLDQVSNHNQDCASHASDRETVSQSTK